jgi:periplasmic divalent cation tolerance protein
MKYILITVTFPEKKMAEEIADCIVRDKLAACAQLVGPIHSTYWWQNKIEKTDEWLCLFKSTAKSFKKIEAVVKQKHSYQVPEITCIPIINGSPEYLNWIRECCRS